MGSARRDPGGLALLTVMILGKRRCREGGADEPGAQHAQPDDDDVVAQMAHPSQSGRLDEATRQQQVGEERDEERGDGHSGEHQRDGE